MIIRKKFITTQWGHFYWGILYVPDNATGKLPMVIFNHGKGEAGTTEADTSKLYTNGPLNFVKNNNWKPDFMILAMQEPYWSPSYTATKYVLDNDEDIKSRWDGTGIITGLSAGGETVSSFLNNYSKVYPGITYVPMSPAGDKVIKDPNVRLWGFSGDSDGFFTDNVKEIVRQTNGRLTIFKGGHCCWNTYYNPNYREVIDGKSMNIYEWGIGKVDTVPTTTTSTTTTTTIAPKVIKSVTIEYTDGTRQVVF